MAKSFLLTRQQLVWGWQILLVAALAFGASRFVVSGGMMWAAEIFFASLFLVWTFHFAPQTLKGDSPKHQLFFGLAYALAVAALIIGEFVKGEPVIFAAFVFVVYLLHVFFRSPKVRVKMVRRLGKGLLVKADYDFFSNVKGGVYLVSGAKPTKKEFAVEAKALSPFTP